jgi:hypothetical protein
VNLVGLTDRTERKIMGTKTGNAKVRPDGKVVMSVTVMEGTYHALRAWAEAWGMKPGEVVDLIAESGGPDRPVRHADRNAVIANTTGTRRWADG